MISYYWQVTLSLSLLIVITRMLPFLFGRFMSNDFNEVGKLLPSYIMLLLVVYELNLKTITQPPYGIPALLSLGLMTAVHLWLKNTFISLISGTAFYILLITTVFA
ncbi:MAG: AzlD domain-containing protein [Legionellales bacterium]